MTVQRWTDDMLDRQAEQIAEMRELVNRISEGQQMLVQIYAQEHDARVEADRRFNRFMERTERFMERTERFMERTERFMERTEQFIAGQQQINQQLSEAIDELRQLVKFSRENGSQN